MGTGVFVVPDLGVFLGPDLGVIVGSGTLRVAVGTEGLSSDSLASAVALILEVDSAGAGTVLEQASTRVPVSTARTTGNFIPSTP